MIPKEIIGARLICIRNLEYMKAHVKESLCKDPFPIIGKPYTIVDNSMGAVSLSEFRMNHRKMPVGPITFDLSAFETFKDAKMRFLVGNMPEYNTPEFWESVRKIYAEMAWIKIPAGYLLYPHNRGFMDGYKKRVAIVGDPLDFHALQKIKDKLLEFDREFKIISIFSSRPDQDVITRFCHLAGAKINLTDRPQDVHKFSGILSEVKMCGKSDVVITACESLDSITKERKAALRYVKKSYRIVFAYEKSTDKVIHLI